MRVSESFVERGADAEQRCCGYRKGMGSMFAKAAVAIALTAGTATACVAQSDADDAFLPSPVRSVSTVPANGDVNPYGVAFVPDSFNTGAGPLKHGDVLVSNFNNVQNLQGTGTTIVRIAKSRRPSLPERRRWDSRRRWGRCGAASSWWAMRRRRMVRRRRPRRALCW
jgi:hypothetical protein